MPPPPLAPPSYSPPPPRHRRPEIHEIWSRPLEVVEGLVGAGHQNQARARHVQAVQEASLGLLVVDQREEPGPNHGPR